MICQAGNVYESANLFNLKKKMTRQTVGFEPTTQMVQYATLTTRPLRICKKRGNNLSTYSINPNPNPNPQKRTQPVSKQFLTLISKGSS